MDRDKANSPRIDCENRGETVVVPIVLAHVGLEAPDSAFQHLMTDLKRAIAVYERMGRGASRHSPAQQRSFSFEVIEADATALDVSHDASQAFADALRQTRALTDMPVYMLSIAREPRAHAAVDLSERISAICRELDVPWGGAVAMGEGELIVPCARCPRMGRMRRARSERIDLLIAAIRSRCSVRDLPDAPASGILVVPRSVPRLLYPLVANFYVRTRS